jgi:predicted DNA-binding protein (MmcQ/YjbR family)
MSGRWGGKVFAIGGRHDGEPSYSFKVSAVSFEMLKEQPGLRPAPYLASRGLTWIQHYALPGLSDPALKDYLRQSHTIVALGLSKRKRAELGLDL